MENKYKRNNEVEDNNYKTIKIHMLNSDLCE